MAELSPMMKQYMEVKQANEDAIVFFRLGDFYEMFFRDAEVASKELEITLTGRDCGLESRAPMCGVPFHSADAYIARLIAKGYKVAICEQAEDPKSAKGIVRREVVRVISPGTLLDTNVLDEKKNNYLCCVYRDEKGAGIGFADITTGEVTATWLTGENSLFRLYNEIGRYRPSELLTNSGCEDEAQFAAFLDDRFSLRTGYLDPACFEETAAMAALERQFHTTDLKAIGLEESHYSLLACGALFGYLQETQKVSLDHIREIRSYTDSSFMELDLNTFRNLEITETMRDKSKAGSLLSVLDRTGTAMGARQLRKWLEQPLINCVEIRKRLNGVAELHGDSMLRHELMNVLKNMLDVERLMSKVTYQTANARDLLSLQNSLRLLPKVKQLLSGCKSGMLAEQFQRLDPLEDLCLLLEQAVADEPPFSVREGGMIREGYHEQVDGYRRALKEGRQWIADLEQKERERTGIKTLKTGYNKVFGYYIEVTKSYQDQVPPHYIRKQTLTNCERYITDELKQLEDTILSADERIATLEYELFIQLLHTVEWNLPRIQETVRAVACVDCLASLAEVASEHHYCMPEVNLSDKIIIQDGRHPVVEQMQKENLFVPNDSLLDRQDNRMAVITGPNMAGKSTYMRQVALITLMAQVGSFVPAVSAQIGIVDKIFTRVGASDDISSGRSTFMVEMSEVAYILQHATPKSLLILDEIGRGTSTFDGLSIAWAVIEHVVNPKELGAKTLFATHYHELTELEQRLPGVKNYCIAVKKRGDDVVFLRKILRGGADDSFGIEVAKLAGVPAGVLKRAKKILASLESEGRRPEAERLPEPAEDTSQLGLADLGSSKLLEDLRQLDISAMSPIEALNYLYQLQQKLPKE